MAPKLISIILIVFLKSFNPLPISEGEINKVSDGLNAKYQEYFEDDMVLNYEQMNSILYPNLRNGLVNENTRWPEGIVFYEISFVFDPTYVQHIKKAMQTIENATCIKFKPRTVDTIDYIYVTGDLSGYHSAVGRQGSKQNLNLALHPFGILDLWLGYTIHTFIHALGFYHQHNSYERDDFVTIRWENIVSGNEHHFDKYSVNMITEFGLRYDYDSIMHYDAYAFSKNDQKTIVTKDPNATIGQRERMSAIDIEKINRMYKCI